MKSKQHSDEKSKRLNNIDCEICGELPSEIWISLPKLETLNLCSDCFDLWSLGVSALNYR